jgi:hypothetical protein
MCAQVEAAARKSPEKVNSKKFALLTPLPAKVTILGLGIARTSVIEPPCMLRVPPFSIVTVSRVEVVSFVMVVPSVVRILSGPSTRTEPVTPGMDGNSLSNA